MNINDILVAMIALVHIYILWFEMFAWKTKGPKVFRSIPKDVFPKTVVMAANQGLYNGFLAAGLIWSFFISNVEWQQNVRYFFLGCILVAGIYGALTASKKIIYIQAIPALIALILVYFNI